MAKFVARMDNHFVESINASLIELSNKLEDHDWIGMPSPFAIYLAD